MTQAQPTVADEIERYLRTGDVNSLTRRGREASWIARTVPTTTVRGALVREARRLADGRTHQPLPEADTSAG